MVRIGLTGGIGAGKSTVSAALAALGASVIDADRLAREVVAPGSEGLAAIVAEFGREVLDGLGALDRAALGARVFADPGARAALNAIVHPAVGARFEELAAAAPPDAIVVHDVPLLVENGLGPRYHLVVVVTASRAVRLERLRRDRGMAEKEALARMAAQAGDAERRAVADVWLDNDGDRASTVAAVEELWSGRLVPYEENLRSGRVAERGPLGFVEPPDLDPWPAQAARLMGRLRWACGPALRDVQHIGPTAAPGRAAHDVLELELGVDSIAAADALAPALALAGFPRVEGKRADVAQPGQVADGPDTRRHANADPGRAVDLYVRAQPGSNRSVRGHGLM